MVVDPPEEIEAYERTQGLVESLLTGKSPELPEAPSAMDADMLRVALLLNSTGRAAEPRAEFVEQLADKLGASERRRSPGRFSRRGLLQGLAGAAGLIVAGAAGEHALSGWLRPSPGAGWVAVARAQEIAPGALRRFVAGGFDGYLLNVDGEFRALSALCTHLPCVLQWEAGSRGLLCPCHGAMFEADGTQRPVPGYDHQLSPLPTVPLQLVAGVLYVNTTGIAQQDDDDDADGGQYPLAPVQPAEPT